MLHHKQPAHKFLAGLHKGGLHRALGIPEDQNIPKDRLASAMNSDDEHVRKMAHLAHAMSSWHKK